MMSELFRRVYERKNFKSAEDRNLFLDKMVAWFDRLFDAWKEETMDDSKRRLETSGITEEELNEAAAQFKAAPDRLNQKEPRISGEKKRKGVFKFDAFYVFPYPIDRRMAQV